jgi:hypothetical protein
VLVRDDGVAKISDFGIARTAGDPALTQTGLFIGTPMYFSPELARGAEPDPSADVWALGATLYAAVEGRPPYEQKSNAVAVISEIANQPPPPPKRAGALEPALRRMLDSDPRSRWSMADAAHALQQLADRRSERTRTATTAAAPRPSPPPTPRPDPPERGPSRRGRGRLLALVAAVAVLLMGGIAFAAVTQDDPGGSPEAAGPASGDRPSSGHPSASPSATSSSEQSPTPSRAPSGNPSGAVGFVQDYYGTVPTDLDAGWSMLGPGMRKVGRDSYEGWWGSVRSVQAIRPSPNAGGQSVDVTLRYTMDDGTVSVERHRIDLIRSDDGGYLLAGETTLG